MRLLLYLIFFLFIYLVINGAIKAYQIYRQIHKVKKQFDDLNRQWYGGSSHANAGGTGNAGANSHASGSTNRQYTTPSGDIIEDRRAEDEINRKLFTQDEGEYVDFEEVK